MNLLKIKNITIGEGAPKIVIPLVGKTKEKIIHEANAVKLLRPDVVEWRVDFYDHVNNLDVVGEILAKLREILADTLLLFTFRSIKEGGNTDIDPAYYQKLNEFAIRSNKIDLVDVELFVEGAIIQDLLLTAQENGVYVIMSNHDFKKTPSKEEIINRLRKMQEYGAHIPKIAVMPNSVEDVLTLLDATYTMKNKYADRPIVTMSMGGTGVITRLSGEVFGSALTFAAGKEASAPGQIPVEELRAVMGILHKRM